MTDEIIKGFEKKLQTLNNAENKFNTISELADKRMSGDIASIQQLNSKIERIESEIQPINPLTATLEKPELLSKGEIQLTQVKSHEDILEIKSDDIKKTRIN